MTRNEILSKLAELKPSLQQEYAVKVITLFRAFSVNPLGVSQVEEYLANQHEHHRKKSFQEEYLAFLDKFEVDYDERYLWD